MRSWTLVTAPTWEPVSLEEVKAQARIDDDYTDALLQGYLVAAREEAEAVLGYAVPEQTWRYDLTEWSDQIPLPMARVLQSVTHVKYYDADGVLQTLSTSIYTTDADSRPAAVVRKPDASWPTLQSDRQRATIQITYVTGWASAALVPQRIKHGIRLFATYLESDRDGASTVGVFSLSEKAREAAYACWSDRMYHVEPCGSTT